MEQESEIPKRKRAPVPRIYSEIMVYSSPRKTEHNFTEEKGKRRKLSVKINTGDVAFGSGSGNRAFFYSVPQDDCASRQTATLQTSEKYIWFFIITEARWQYLGDGN